jgi:Zn-dependent M16 (insulinase) family peptidase
MWKRLRILLLLFCWNFLVQGTAAQEPLSTLRKGHQIADFRVANLYSDPAGKVIGAKFWHVYSGTPVFFFQIETVPQVFTWIDTPTVSNRGLPHALEHLLAGKGAKGRYFTLLRDMRMGVSQAATVRDFNYYGMASASGMPDFLPLLHSWLDALYHPDFTDVEAEREFYHFAVTTDAKTNKRVLVEQGTVYDEMQPGQGRYVYHYGLFKRAFGEQNPLGFYNGGLPDEMRGVTPEEIRQFHSTYYRLGPTAGFIFVMDPKQNIAEFLQKLSAEFRQIAVPKSTYLPSPSVSEPKYAVHSSSDIGPKIYPYPGGNDATPGFVHFAWKPKKTESAVDVKMLELFFQTLAEGERSTLYRAIVDSKTREIDAQATGVDFQISLANSPSLPLPILEISGIPGNHILAEKIQQLRALVLAKIEQISEYPDRSKDLLSFNDVAASDAMASHRSESVWVRNSPNFGASLKTDWKEHLAYLETDPAFIRSVSEEEVWQTVAKELQSGRNIWRDLIRKFGLLDTPYATASAPSTQLLAKLEKNKQDRIQKKTLALMAQYHTDDEQIALIQFQKEEAIKSQAIDKIDASVPRPRFTNHPPMTPDEGVRFREFQVSGTPVIATLFDNPPTIDIGISFDLTQVPAKYYKYIPILPRCLDSLGLKQPGRNLSYSELLNEIHRNSYDFSVAYEWNPSSRRRDFTIRASATNPQEFHTTLALVRDIMQSNDLDASNIMRLRDLVARRVSGDDAYMRQDGWITNPAYAVRYQDDPLSMALISQFTRAHWDARLQWLFHDPVDAAVIEGLTGLTDRLLDSSGVSKNELAKKLAASTATGVEKEMIDYWQKNLNAFAESELPTGLRQLTREVQEDLRTGPTRAIEDIKTLQKIILTRSALHVDLTVAHDLLDKIQPDLLAFLQSIPANNVEDLTTTQSGTEYPIFERLKKRHDLVDPRFPFYLAFSNPEGITANLIFQADFPGYTQIDRTVLVRELASKLLGGNGSQSLFFKAWEHGLAYDDGLVSRPTLKLIWYYANRVADVPSLISLVDSQTAKLQDLHDPLLVDYTLRETFPMPRSMSTFAERGKELAHDIRDGNGPEQMRRFSEAVLKLRQDPNLLSELTRESILSIRCVLPTQEYVENQRSARSVFFFAGTEQTLSEIQNRAQLPKLLRVWPSDYWIH